MIVGAIFEPVEKAGSVIADRQQAHRIAARLTAAELLPPLGIPQGKADAILSFQIRAIAMLDHVRGKGRRDGEAFGLEAVEDAARITLARSRSPGQASQTSGLGMNSQSGHPKMALPVIARQHAMAMSIRAMVRRSTRVMLKLPTRARPRSVLRCVEACWRGYRAEG